MAKRPTTTGLRIRLVVGPEAMIGPGKADATDARAEPKVEVLGMFADDTHPAIAYPVARTTSSPSDAATSFLDFLATPEARAAFEAEGFAVLD